MAWVRLSSGNLVVRGQLTRASLSSWGFLTSPAPIWLPTLGFVSVGVSRGSSDFLLLVPSSHNHQNKNYVQLVIIIKIRVRTTWTSPVKFLCFSVFMAVFFFFILTIAIQIIYLAGSSFGYCFVILIFSILLVISEHPTNSIILLEVF